MEHDDGEDGMKGLGVITSRKSDEWYTPMSIFRQLSSEFGPFDLDPCATKENAKCETYYSISDDGLSREWFGKVFVNPPYSKIALWVEKCWSWSMAGVLVVALLPARTDTKWFHQYVQGNAEVRFIKGRLKFGGSNNNAPFPSMIVIWSPR